MNQFEIEDLFKSLGYECLEDNLDCEVKDYGFYARFGNDTREIQFENRDGMLQVHIVNYQDPSKTLKLNNQLVLIFAESNHLWKKINSFEVSQPLSVVLAEQVKFIKEMYKGEIE
jgi:hypothetical protein